jgi:hypothetical protein
MTRNWKTALSIASALSAAVPRVRYGISPLCPVFCFGTDVIWIHLPSIANARAPRNFLRSMRNVPALLVRLRWNAKLFEALPQFPHILVNTIRAALLQFVAIETA